MTERKLLSTCTQAISKSYVPVLKKTKYDCYNRFIQYYFFMKFTILASKKNYMKFKFSWGNKSVPFYYLIYMAHVHFSFMGMSLKGSCYVVAL